MTAVQSAINALGMSTGVVALSPAAGGPRPSGQITLAGRVLLAEDGLDNQQIISLHLRKAGAEVVIAGNGRIAIELATSHSPNLILMDIEMPQLDGYSATRQLRQQGCRLPIVALTAHCGLDDRAKCLAAGCTDYITKPIDRSTLLATVASFLPGGRSNDAAAAAAPAAAHPQIAPNPPAASQRLKSSFADDPAMQTAIAEFVVMLPYRVALMNEMLADGKIADLRRMVHQMKGAGGGYGFEEITRLASRADCALNDEAPLATIASEIELLIALIRSVEGYQPSREQFHA